MTKSLFNFGVFKLHSGTTSTFKIDCDALTKKDYNALAMYIAQRFNFNSVIGVPTGGLALAKSLEAYCINDSRDKSELHVRLVVDDVLTTGNSINELKDLEIKNGSNFNYLGIVLFARGTCPDWVYPMFKLNI